VEAIAYIIRLDYPWDYESNLTIRNWREYMSYVERETAYAPDFAQWDEHTREVERLADDARSQSKRVFKEYHQPEKRLPKEVVEGIDVRHRLLKGWIESHVDEVRGREDYQRWKMEKDTPPQSSQGISHLEMNRWYYQTLTTYQ
jgi:hypothetical protein